MAHVLILTQVFPPDAVSTAQIMGDLAVDLVAKGHRVTVLTTCPHYNRDEEAEASQPLEECWGPLLKRSGFHGATVLHTAMPQKSKGVWRRIFAWMGFHAISTVAGMAIPRGVDVVITPSPPLTIGLSAWLLGLFHRCPYIYNVQEIYPDIAIRLGALKDGLAARALFRLERFVYRHAARITVIAPNMRENLLAKGTPPQKVEVIPNFVDVEQLGPAPKDNPFSQAHGLAHSFVVGYAGNMGPAQGLETLVEAAHLLRAKQEIKFLFMGNGTLQDALRKDIEEREIENVVFLPYQPYSIMAMAYGAADLNVVPLAATTGGDALPSKVYRIMACAGPVLAITEKGSDLAALVESVGCGYCCQPGNAALLAETILAAYEAREGLAALGTAGRVCVEQKYSRLAVTGRYEELVRSLCPQA
jgi:colanic acid biosynthesis glycosyl transferase WcaI